jgi:hypothetical protein
MQRSIIAARRIEISAVADAKMIADGQRHWRGIPAVVAECNATTSDYPRNRCAEEIARVRESFDITVTVQLVNTEGECWEAVFAAPAMRVTGRLFKDQF